MESKFQSKRGKQFSNFGKAQFAGAAVFKCVERGATDTSLARERCLAKFERFAPLGDPIADQDQIEHMHSILRKNKHYKRCA